MDRDRTLRDLNNLRRAAVLSGDPIKPILTLRSTGLKVAPFLIIKFVLRNRFNKIQSERVATESLIPKVHGFPLARLGQ